MLVNHASQPIQRLSHNSGKVTAIMMLIVKEQASAELPKLEEA